MTIRLGLIGCGEHSESGHAIPLARYKAAHPEQVELCAACDIQPGRAQRFCEKYGFACAYPDVDEMLAHEKLDGCIAVVPAERIAECGIKLLRLRMPCVVEKPLGSSFEEVRALVNVARETLTPNMVSVNRRFMPFLNHAAKWARAAGPLRYVRATLFRHARTEPEFLWTTAVHAVDALRYVAGEFATAEIRAMGKGSPGWYGIDIQFENGVAGRVDVLPTAGMLEESYELVGESFRASVTAPFGLQRGWRGFRDNQLREEEIATGSTPEDVLNGCYDEAAEFIRSLESKDAPQPSIQEVFPSVKLCLELATTQKSTNK
jgi:myo-inositol 2-dehydrogenase/D-chiro-inositol 1-dehydrogenase